VKPVLVVQHAEIEGPAALADVLRDAGCDIAVVRADVGEKIPGELSEFAALIVMGGPMSAASDDSFPTRRAELSLLRTALAGSIPTLGVCLGAQLLAAAARADVYLGAEPEIGWHPVTLTAAAETDPLLSGIDGSVNVLHWHGETFDLPDGAVHLAESKSYANQAFRLGSSAWGLQFHVEVDAAAVERFVVAFPEDAEHSPGSADAIRATAADAVDALRDVQRVITTRFAQLALAASS
jgi:GMP synthase-like glutamine amidotransferase